MKKVGGVGCNTFMIAETVQAVDGTSPTQIWLDISVEMRSERTLSIVLLKSRESCRRPLSGSPLK